MTVGAVRPLQQYNRETQRLYEDNGTKDGLRKLKEVLARWDNSAGSGDRVSVGVWKEED